LRLEISTATTLPREQIYHQNSIPVYKDEIGNNPGMLFIFDDIPVTWDAWDVMDYHLEMRSEPVYNNMVLGKPFASGPIVGGYKWSATFGNDSVVTRYAIIRSESPMIE